MSIDYEISRVQSQIAEQRNINYELRTELGELTSGINQASDHWQKLTQFINGTLQTGAARVADSHEIALRAYELENEIEKMYALYKQMEKANKKIRECKNRIYYEFANYRAVRKIVEAMLNNIEVSFVSDSTLTKAIEKKHLQLPDYWLTCALLAIMAWKRDDKTMAEKTLERACKLDLKNSSIFFFAFHLRMGKLTTALKWFQSYQQCEHTGEDQLNILILFSVAANTLREEIDDSLTNAVSLYIDQMMQEQLQTEGYSEQEVVSRITACLSGLQTHEAIDYPVLCKNTKEKDYLFYEMNAARSTIAYLDFIKKTVHVTDDSKKNYLNDFIDDVIRRSNAAEKDVNNEIVRNEYIISYQGDVESAEKTYQEYLAHKENQFDIIREMIEWIYHPDQNVGASERMRMFIMTKALNQMAVEAKVNEYRSRFKYVLEAKIGDYETSMDFNAHEAERQKVDEYFRAKEQELLSMVKLWPAFVFFGIAVLALVLTIIVKQPIFIVGTVFGVLAGVLKILLSNRKKSKISKDCAIEAENTKGIVDSMFDEFSRYVKEYQENDAHYNEILSEFEVL